MINYVRGGSANGDITWNVSGNADHDNPIAYDEENKVLFGFRKLGWFVASPPGNYTYEYARQLQPPYVNIDYRPFKQCCA